MVIKDEVVHEMVSKTKLVGNFFAFVLELLSDMAQIFFG
jgi:hypothetical protein